MVYVWQLGCSMRAMSVKASLTPPREQLPLSKIQESEVLLWALQLATATAAMTALRLSLNLTISRG